MPNEMYLYNIIIGIQVHIIRTKFIKKNNMTDRRSKNIVILKIIISVCHDAAAAFRHVHFLARNIKWQFIVSLEIRRCVGVIAP